jgi:transcriptional regulator with XRE-family HTH domain
MSDLAQRISSAREKLGVSIDEAERATKIRRRYIEAIEAGDFDRLPDGPPSRGFIKNYARYLGMDPDQSLTDFEAEVGVPITQISEVVPPPPTRQQAVSRYTQLVKLPPGYLKSDFVPGEQTQLAENANQASDLGAPQIDADRLVLRRSETSLIPNSFSLREPKVIQATDVRPFLTGRSLFSLRNLTTPFSSQATAQPHRIAPMSVNGTDNTRALFTLGAIVGAAVLVVAFVGLVILPAVRGASPSAAGAVATQAISISFIGGTPAGPATPGAPAGGGTTGGTPAAPADQPAGQPAAVQPAAGGGVLLVLDAHEHSWVRVLVDGNVAYEGIPPIGPNSQWHGQNTVGIETGNAGAFDVILNNTRIGPPGAHDATVKLTWDATGKVIP